ncbi:hypothetical protein DDB_G0280563 [Dictyostelium discoideum AX4]|uniref:Putative uncharacterized protein DDB_G0280563 n=1 Tax=Dictyostelium discoideum TaxID=44689 RepID=Y6044_DICDI|nr:hypothetical protein DDB_G0280563 [Dictyostelium discoideum AX4]Q54V79.1 RecName: Full=Putative uncharacterized protein DDB_G0280563 [Dictyostelium discoideum]EAL67083.1 hypothetical protein DDB_G0280563 [Dictyostelium discoideum AX4]|eukprot:XP_641052.1 hypothetical protein DDB_G0280563 [Dictyostelium discoideum AX4]
MIKKAMLLIMLYMVLVVNDLILYNILSKAIIKKSKNVWKLKHKPLKNINLETLKNY